MDALDPFPSRDPDAFTYRPRMERRNVRRIIPTMEASQPRVQLEQPAQLLPRPACEPVPGPISAKKGSRRTKSKASSGDDAGSAWGRMRNSQSSTATAGRKRKSAMRASSSIAATFNDDDTMEAEDDEEPEAEIHEDDADDDDDEFM